MTSPKTNPQDLVERFTAAFNGIEQELNRRVAANGYVPFAQLVDRYAQANPSWRPRLVLKEYAKLRNFVVHTPTVAYERLAIPTLPVVEDIEKIKAGFSNTVIPRFARQVTVVTPDTSLAQVLNLVNQYSFSQFPVQDNDNVTRGLLTENGITRWLARHTVNNMCLVDFDEVYVAAVIGQEEMQSDYSFVSHQLLVDEAFSMFAKSPLLEALLITGKGEPTEPLLGIITRWDVLTGG